MSRENIRNQDEKEPTEEEPRNQEIISKETTDDEMIDAANKIWDKSVPMSDEQRQEIISKIGFYSESESGSGKMK